MRPILTTRSILLGAALGLTAPGVSAQGNPPGTIVISASITGLQQFEAGGTNSGRVGWSAVAASGSISRQIVPAFTLGGSITSTVERWTLKDAAAFPPGSPWRELRRTNIGLPMTLALSRSVLIGCSVSAQWAAEPGADATDAATYGAVLSVGKVFDPRLTLGTGASVSRQFYSTKVSPFLIINWRLNQRLRIANAHSAGPLGGAGIELRCAIDPLTELALGGVTSSDRYRLADSGPYPGAVGERAAIRAFARASRKFGEYVRADVYAGVLTQGRVRIKDDDGRELASTHYSTAPALAATLAFRR